jgi:hypothetical protein
MSLLCDNNEHSLTSPEQKCTGEFGALAGDNPSLPGTTNRGLWKVYVFTCEHGTTGCPEKKVYLLRSSEFVGIECLITMLQFDNFYAVLILPASLTCYSSISLFPKLQKRSQCILGSFGGTKYMATGVKYVKV